MARALLTQAGPDAAERAELAGPVPVAMLVVLESLTPEERAVFELREEINASPGTLMVAGGRAIAALTLTVSKGRVAASQLLANPDKLTAISAGRTLPRC